MKSNYLLFAYILTAVVELILLGCDLSFSIYLRPICVVLIYSYYVVSVKKHNFFLLFYLTCELINEMFFLIDFTRYFTLVMLCYSLATFSMLHHLWPLYTKANFKTELNELLRPLLGLIAVMYIFWELTFMVFDNLPNNLVFFPALLALLSWLFFCTLIPVKNKHPDNFALYIMGGAMGVMAPSMFIYEFLWSKAVVLYFSLFSMIILKIFLVTYLIKLQNILKSREEYF